MKKILTLSVACIAIFIFLGLMPVHGEAEIYDNVIRLHVLANSDSDEDQKLKLEVRDVILKEVSEMCIDVSDIDEAEKMIRNKLSDIEAVAEKYIKEVGYDYDVSIDFDKEIYATKNYNDFSFPAGKYLSLQVKIGAAEGKNWWCVLFPPMCLSAAVESKTDAEAALTDIGLSGEQYKIITDNDNAKYNVRFKILETIEKAIS
jgi:stage II sporulation protein R